MPELADIRGSLVVLTGASGGGKTTIAIAIETLLPKFAVFRFDTIAIPSADVMAAFGPGHEPGGAWQRAMTLQWFDKIAPKFKAGGRILFEGQMRIGFIREALAIHNVANARVALVECDDETRAARLINARRQPELANNRMMRWSQYLHQEALEVGCEILDTGKIPLAQSVRQIATYLGNHSSPGKS